jgi:hypothetical protein
LQLVGFMPSSTRRWPKGSGRWNRNLVAIVSADGVRRERLIALWSKRHDVVFATTPLEVILLLEHGDGISTVVIADLVGSAHASELAQFLDACYPWLRVVESHDGGALCDEQIALAT